MQTYKHRRFEAASREARGANINYLKLVPRFVGEGTAPENALPERSRVTSAGNLTAASTMEPFKAFHDTS